tara:strand:- start:5008 stop:5685 length:678 start_codon:yes stop_codon:yes gene_type:complete
MKKALIILLLLTSSLHADKTPKRNVSVADTPPSTGIKTDVNGHLMVEHTGIVSLTKKGERARYNVVGASKNGTLLLSLNNKADHGAFKVQLAKGAKVKYIEPQDQKDGKALTDVNGHLMVEHSGIKTDVGGHLIVEATGIKTIFAEYWPPPITQTDNEAHLLIVKAFGLLVSYGQIKLKKPPLTPEQRAERARRLLETGSGFIDSHNSSDRTSGKTEEGATDERK